MREIDRIFWIVRTVATRRHMRFTGWTMSAIAGIADSMRSRVAAESDPLRRSPASSVAVRNCYWIASSADRQQRFRHLDAEQSGGVKG
jgi:hypothetical protein